ncbi:MAG: hypothetical protein ACI4LC_05475 [Emergencia sp.]
MFKKCTTIMNNINDGKYTGREIMLSGAVLFLTGTVLGMVFSPRKYQMIGSNNGNGSCNGNEAKAERKQKN